MKLRLFFLPTLIFIVPAQADTKMKITDVPQAVRQSIESHAGQGEIIEIEVEQEGGKAVYEVEVKAGGAKTEFKVSETGEYLGTDSDADEDNDNEDGDDDAEENIEWAQVPQAVQAGITASLGGAAPTLVTREEDDGFAYFEAEYEANGAEHSIKLTEDGFVVEKEEAVSEAALPAAVSAAVRGEIKEVELVTVTFYEIEVKKGDHVREIKILSNGQVINSDDDDDEGDDDDHDINDDDNHEDHGKHEGKSDGHSSK